MLCRLNKSAGLQVAALPPEPAPPPPALQPQWLGGLRNRRRRSAARAESRDRTVSAVRGNLQKPEAFLASEDIDLGFGKAAVLIRDGLSDKRYISIFSENGIYSGTSGIVKIRLCRLDDV